MRIALVLDNPYRDLAGLTLLALRLVQAGAECYLVPFNLADAELGALCPDYVLLNYLRQTNRGLAYALIEQGVHVGILDTEGGVLVDFDDYSSGKMTSDSVLRHHVTHYFGWGPRLASHAVEAGWYKAEQVKVTGSPRFDFYVDPLRAVPQTLASDHHRFKVPIILINSSFSLANPVFNTLEQEAIGWSHLGYDLNTVKQMQQTMLRTMHEIAKLANEIAKRFSQASVIYRPHPFERLETYHSLLEPLDNLSLIREGSVDSWILQASAVVQRSCSTAIESGMAGVPALSPDWIPTALDIKSIEDVSIPCKTPDALFERLAEALQSGHYVAPPEIQANIDRVVADWFYRLDGKAHQRVAESIIEAAQGMALQVSARAAKAIHYGRFTADPTHKQVAGLLRQLLRLPATWSVRRRKDRGGNNWDTSLKHFNAAEVQTLVNVIAPYINADSQTFTVTSAEASGQYRFSYPAGRSVVISQVSGSGGN